MIEAMKQALEALKLAKSSHGVILTSYPAQDAWVFHGVDKRCFDAITALRQAIEQAEKQEPVAWLVSDAQGRYATIRDPAPYGEEVYEPLYAAPPRKEWVGLTEDEMSEIYNKNYDLYDTDMTYMDFFMVQREVEAKLKEKNGDTNK